VTAQNDIVLEVRGLTIAYETDAGENVAVENVSFAIRRQETFGLAGESGSGKSTIANAILGLLGDNGRVVSGSIHCDGVDVLALRGEALRTFRWSKVAMVFQSAMNALNPVMTVRDQIVDVFTTHTGMRQREARSRAVELLELVGIDRSRAKAYPHQLSGGMRQRAVIATALALKPSLLILDEPTTALDVVVQQEIIEEIKRLQEQLGFAVLFITHDLSLMVEISQNIAIMRHGTVLESGEAHAIYQDPQHPYTKKLVEAFPPVTRSLDAGSGPEGEAEPPEPTREAVVQLEGITKTFRQGQGFAKRLVTAVDHVDLRLEEGEILALVGESGSGKSTVARMLARLERPTSGRMVVDGIDVLRTEPHRASRAYRRGIQIVFQDPFGSLNPAYRVRHFVERPLVIHFPQLSKQERGIRIRELMRSVELSPDLLERYPHELSGGQRQRVAIARALAVEPRVILADEPTSMLDVSVRMGVLQLMRRLRDERGISILYITHDLASARYLADRTVVMLRGVLVEGGASDQVMDHPVHPYTRLLVSATPDPLRTIAFDRDERATAREAIAAAIERRSARTDIPADTRRWISQDHWVDVSDLDPVLFDSMRGTV
jgi:peptide/nickel transport system ATP-binding protein